MGRASIPFVPRLMTAPDAAAYLGMSPSRLRTLPIPRKVDGAKRLYDARDLDEYAAALPYEGDQDGAVAEWDKRISGA